MSDYKHLKDEQYYTDLYDLITIKDCLGTIEFYSKPLKATSELEKKMSPDEVKRGKMLVTDISIYFKKGERYRNKASTIREWMQRDKEKDEFVEKTPEPKNISCSHCGNRMKSTMKELYDHGDDKMRVLFFFECPICQKRKGIFDNGEQFNSGTKTCPQCSRELTVSYKKEGNVVTRIRNCGACNFSEIEMDDYDAQDAGWQKKQQADKELLEKYRASFCITGKEGQEYIAHTDNTTRIMDILKDREIKQADPNYHKAMQLKKLGVVELEKLLSEAFEKEKYIKLVFEKPEIDQYVIISFTVQEADTSRKEYDSKHKLQKLIKATLEGTNWRLMSEGVMFRLGYLTGKLKGYEREEDLIKIVKSK